VPFGELHRHEARPYDATLRALTPMALYRLDADKLRALAKKHAELERRLRQRFALKLAMLEWGRHQLTTVDVDLLLGAGEERRLRAGGFVFREGDAVDGAYVVVSGQVELRARVNGRARRLVRVGPGEVFGEVELLARKKARTSSARATARTCLVRLDLGAAAERMEHFDIVQRQLAALAERRERARLGHKRHL
jgi:CRP-like cAMP-binding protein